jgi:mannose-6-phosphate isomerase
VFPLLIKLIDAQQDLSIQVHPDDATAPAGQLGKHEAYYVLDAAPGAKIALGLRPDTDRQAFEAAVRSGQRVADLLTWTTAQPGSTFLSPARTVHALGAGCLVYEIQQPSDVTYRLDDWGRVDAAGKPRALHVDEGLAVIDPGLRPEVIPHVSLGTSRQLLAACKRFALERIMFEDDDRVEIESAGSAQALTCLAGPVDVATTAGSVRLVPGETAVIAAAAEGGRLASRGRATVLRGWVPDLWRDIVVPARAVGHPDHAISVLGGPLPDVGDALRFVPLTP